MENNRYLVRKLASPEIDIFNRFKRGKTLSPTCKIATRLRLMRAFEENTSFSGKNARYNIINEREAYEFKMAKRWKNCDAYAGAGF